MVGTVSRLPYGLNVRGGVFRFSAGSNNFCSIRPNLGPTQPTTPWVPEGLSRGVNWPRPEDED